MDFTQLLSAADNPIFEILQKIDPEKIDLNNPISIIKEIMPLLDKDEKLKTIPATEILPKIIGAIEKMNEGNLNELSALDVIFMLLDEVLKTANQKEVLKIENKN